MKMKKMLAILAALSVLGTTGLTVGAEDTATTTEPATEASTTTETEAETTATETTAETETTVETAATEENQVVGKQLINKGDVLTFSGTLSYANGKNRPILNLDTPIEATVGGVDETVTYVRLNEESLTYADGARLTVTGTVDLTVFAGTGQNVVFLSNNTITENNATTTTTAAETTPTTTTTTTSEADLEAAKKALYDKFVAAYGKPVTANYGDFNNDGKLDAYYTYYLKGVGYTTYLVTDDAIVNAGGVPGDYAGITDYAFFECNGYRFRMNFRNRIVATYATGNVTIDRIESDGTLKQVNFGENVLSDSYEVSGTPNYTADLSNDQVGKASTYFSCDGNVLTITHYFYDNGRDVGSNSYVYDAATNTFVAGGTTDDNQEKTFTVEIPTSYVKAFCYKRGQEITESNYKDSMVITSTTITGCTNGTVSIVPNGYFIGSFLVKDAKPGTITITGTTGTFSSSEDPNVNVNHGQCGAGIGDRLDSFTVTVTIDENGNIVTGDNGNSGKTDNGSASNAPATKNTSGTPKTGDMTTVPAVAVGLTLTAAGVVAFISKRKK